MQRLMTILCLPVLWAAMGCQATTMVSASVGVWTLSVSSSGDLRLAAGGKIVLPFVTLAANTGASEDLSGNDDGWVLVVRHTRNGSPADAAYRLEGIRTPHVTAVPMPSGLPVVEFFLNKDRHRLLIVIPAGFEATVQISDESEPPLASVQPSLAGGSGRHLDAPGGGGWAKVDTLRRHITVCDTAANDRGVRAEFTVNDPSGKIHSVGDGNGSKPGCGEERLGDFLITGFRVCESDSGTGANPSCTLWEVIS